jgi:predicted RNA-binding protein YlxR (DUF448 family)/ribosomal protein L7Ae-like RNA K-turn-binding protein
MDAAFSSAPEAQAKRLSPVRDASWCCLATGDVLPKDELIRFVVDPDNNVVPDLARNLPGQGLWVKVDYEAITLAAKQGLFGKMAKAPVKTAPNLADQVIKLLRVRCLAFLGLAKGAGVAVLGQTQVEMALREKKLGLLLLADDAKAELVNLRKIPIYHLFSRDELGQALGFAQIVYAGLRPHGLTKSLKTELYRLEKLIQTSPDRKNG